MSRIVRVLMWVLVIVAIFIAIAFFLPRNIFVERSITIEASPKIVFSQINDLHSWNNWSKWNLIDPEMKIEYSNNGVGVNAGYKWESENKQVGTGSLLILESAKYDSIVVNIDFMEQGAARSVFQFTETKNGTIVNWVLQYDLGNNPASRWMGLMMDKFIRSDFEEGLSRLNALCKILEENKTPIVELENLNEFTFASIRANVSFNEISLKMGEMYVIISAFLATTDAEMAGMPYAIYHLMNGEEIDLECGIPVTNKLVGNDKINTGTYSTTKCATVDFYGDYHLLEQGHTAIQEWIEKRGFTLAGAPVEIYITDPVTEPDPENWLTKIYYPVE